MTNIYNISKMWKSRAKNRANLRVNHVQISVEISTLTHSHVQIPTYSQPIPPLLNQLINNRPTSVNQPAYPQFHSPYYYYYDYLNILI